MNILLGITGSIAAYKAAEIVRLLIKNEHAVKVIMTDNAKQFIHPNTLATLSGNPVYDDLFDQHKPPMTHIELAKWADIILIAPATASCLARLATGLADDLLTTTYLASTANIIIAPAMNKHMWAHPAVAHNLKQLKSYGITILDPDTGTQACGDYGEGRLLEPQTIVDVILKKNTLLTGKKVVITAGPTLEPIDPVRFISNHSSGKMGYALAEAAILLGAHVILISGPTTLEKPRVANFISVTTADSMHAAVMNHSADADVFISCAAVADYKPTTVNSHKIKKSDQHLSLELTKTIDIVSDVAKLANKPFTIGFALESESLLANAGTKLVTKKLDMIIANQITADTTPFNSDDIEVVIISRKQGEMHIKRDTKKSMAVKIMDLICEEVLEGVDL